MEGGFGKLLAAPTGAFPHRVGMVEMHTNNPFSLLVVSAFPVKLCYIANSPIHT